MITVLHMHLHELMNAHIYSDIHQELTSFVLSASTNDANAILNWIHGSVLSLISSSNIGALSCTSPHANVKNQRGAWEEGREEEEEQDQKKVTFTCMPQKIQTHIYAFIITIWQYFESKSTLEHVRYSFNFTEQKEKLIVFFNFIHFFFLIISQSDRSRISQVNHCTYKLLFFALIS